ncbi:hypothetical protein DRO56_02300 [Candidatus Bathyarchaeota archaeon]|nr:MAG: hypothetical protein DRO56_02300 [Candidatus Bathyarchaeota archaeon]
MPRGEYTTIPVERETRDLLKRLGRKDERYEDIIRGLLRQVLPLREEGAVPLPVREEVYRFLQHLGEAMRDAESMTPVDVKDLPARLLSKVCLVLGYRGDSFLDMGFSRVASAKIATFLGTDDDFTALSMVVVGSMNSLIERFGVKELKPVLEEVVRILVRRKALKEDSS